jgi:alkanesulfonate monooxygenase SsuD/methylene tetrahydromethanopterin reductase-like flavin-dependent oxidoreductase (luciferase family)
VRLRTNILLGATREPVLLAKQAATVDQLSGGRFVLGLGVGRRTDDYEVVGKRFTDRGRRLDAAVEQMRDEWSSGRSSPGSKPVPILFGGALDVALPRILAHGEGWTTALRPAHEVAPLVEELRAAWRDAGRTGDAEVVVMQYYALGDDSSVDYIFDYYGYQGDRSKTIAEGAIRTADQAAEAVAAFRDIGIDEYVFAPTTATIEQVDLLADAVLG